MFFTRTHNFHFSVPKEDLKNRLVGKHVRIHNLDFEVLEEDQALSIIPHAEQENAIKTLPITHVDLKADGDKTKVVMTSKMRMIDSGGPMLIMIICAVLVATGVLLLYTGGDPVITYAVLGVGISIFTVFCVRMQIGYFDYVRKIRTYVENAGAPASMPFATA